MLVEIRAFYNAIRDEYKDFADGTVDYVKPSDIGGTEVYYV